MRIAVTNDDGVHAPGIARLAAHLRDAGHEVVVCAPDGNLSGAGASTGADLRKIKGIAIEPTTVAGLDAHRVSSTPAVCALLAVRGAFGGPVDLVMSGINPGTNMGPSVLHSGTVGAVVTAANFGVPGLAVSMDAEEHAPDEIFDSAASWALFVLDNTDLGGPPRAMSLNVPGLPASEVKGVRATGLDATPGFRAAGVRTVEPLASGGRLVSFVYEPVERRLDADGDVAAVRSGWASLSWLTSISADEAPRGAWREGRPTSLV
ncbi:5'/3'-nucleotidase SurE [Nocardioides soli]|uniref:5'/3'-nucleotidase SurE n=1 Tax=Nocardioides soli TaxID=1036020 RepID=UPI001615EF2D|nr:5'/3'-nucleotidase SurE [Nocardioides soli]